MKQLNISATNHAKLVAIISWADHAPGWFDTGDRFWEHYNDTVRELVEDGIEGGLDWDRYEFNTISFNGDQLILQVLDGECESENYDEVEIVLTC
jgi:hypothetical protein